MNMDPRQNSQFERGDADTKRSRPFLAAFLFLIVAFVLIFAAYLRNYAPDPEANINLPVGAGADMPGIITPDYDEDVFAGMKQVKGRYNFLLVGLDRVSRSTDIMMIVSYDVKSGQINVVQIPRDTYLTQDGIRGAFRINSYYSVYYNYANRNDFDDPEMSAITSLAALIEHSLRVRINYCAVVDLEGFVNIVDAVGGVYLDVPVDMFYEDPYQDLYIDLKAGYQHLDGEHAMQFVRFRKGYVQQDIGRQDALKNFMAAFMTQVKENLSVTTVVNVAAEVMKNMRTNISAADFVYFGKSALSVDLSGVKMMTLPGEAVTVDGASVYVLCRDDTVAALNKYLNVFDTDITGEDFDPDRVLCKEGDEASLKIYEKPLGSVTNPEYNAEDVNDNPIDIPRQ